MKIDISGVDKGALLAECFNGSSVSGMGVFQAGRGPKVMTYEQGREIIEQALAGNTADDNTVMFPGLKRRRPDLYFDYLFGRPLKIDLTGDEVDSWGYDRDNGGDGALQRLVDKVKSA